MQSKKLTHYEVLTNQAAGSIGGWLIVMFLFPLFNHLQQEYVATISSFIFFIWSYTRSYIIRRVYNEKN